MMPYSSFKAIWALSVIEYLGHWGNLGRLNPNISNQSKGVIHRKPLKVFNSTLHAKWGLAQGLGHWDKSGILGSKTPNCGHVIQSVKLHNSHQMKPYSNVKVMWESIYTVFCVSVELKQVG